MLKNTIPLFYQEQQSWTPVISGQTTAGTGTYTTQAGFYTCIGNMVFLQAVIVWTAHTGTGNMLITGLPFTSRNTSNYIQEGIVNPISIPLPASSLASIASLQPNATQLNLVTNLTNAANSAIQMNNTGTLHLTITYLT